MARPSRVSPPTASRDGLTPALLARIAEAARGGLKDPQVYALLGIPRQTWHDWLREEASGLADAIARARAEMARDLLAGIQKMPRGWQAGVWLLTQHFPGDYTRPAQDSNLNHSGEVNGTLQVLSEADAAKLRDARRGYLARMNEAAPIDPARN